VVRLAIVGAGMMGSRHARVARAIPAAEVAVVVDQDEYKGRKLAEHVGAASIPPSASATRQPACSEPCVRCACP
jgi:predicted dehydrogenase